MNLVYLNFRAGMGGHTRTSVTTARVMRERGHGVEFVVSNACNPTLIEEAGFPVHTTRRGWAYGFPDLNALLARLKAEGTLGLAHVFTRPGHAETAKAAKRLDVPYVYTICGGAPPKRILPVRSIVSLSGEVKAGLLESHDLEAGDVTVIPARVDTEEMASTFEEAKAAPRHIDELKEKYDISTSATILFRVARCSPGYENSVHEGIEAAAALRNRGHEVCFVHFGYADVQRVYRRIKEHVETVNQRFDDVVAVTVQDEALQAQRYCPMADIVMGTGRSAFEGMLCEKPTFIIGARGYAGLINEENIDEIAFYNFSGRNTKQDIEQKASVAKQVALVERLIEDDAYRAAVARFGKDYVLDQLDAAAAAEPYERVYGNFHSARHASESEIRKYSALAMPDRLKRLPLYRKFRASMKSLFPSLEQGW